MEKGEKIQFVGISNKFRSDFFLFEGLVINVWWMKRGQRDAYGSPQLGRPHSPDSTDDRECRAIAVSSQQPPIAACSPTKGGHT